MTNSPAEKKIETPTQNENIIRVEHPGAYGPAPKDVVEEAKHSVTVAGSHTVYFMRKPTEGQLEAAIKPVEE